MKKFILSFFIVGGFALYTIYYGSRGTLIFVPSSTAITSTKNKNTANTNIQVAKSLVVTNNKSTLIQNQAPVQKNSVISTTNMRGMNNGNMGRGMGGGMMNKGIFNDGEYIGDSVDAYYGYIQVKAVITNGKLSDVVFLDYPQDRGNSIRINTYAMPILKSEAIKAQSSNVNTVSGATDSSGAFRQSLASALAQAKV